MRYDHIGMLPYRAFSPVGKQMTLEGGKDADMPKAPDYMKVAEQQANLQGQLIDKTTAANRVNQYTPWGSIEWSQGGGSPRTFDQAGYDRALSDYNNRASAGAYGANQYGDGLGMSYRQLANTIGNNYATTGANAGAGGGNLRAPNRDDFYTGGAGGSGQWSQTMKLTPEMQALLDQNIGAKGESYNQLMNSLGNWENLPQAPINPGQTAQDAIMARLNPTFQQEDETVRNRLYNQGVRPGTEAWDNEMRNFERARNDAYSQAALQGINLDFQNRQRAITEQGVPINLINAYLSGSQVQSPQFPNYSQQANQTAPDLMGAAQSQYGAGLNSYNASQAAGSNFMGGLLGIGGALGSAVSGSLFGKMFGF
jgi:hypothetical protein